MEVPEDNHWVSIDRLDFIFADIFHPCIVLREG